MAVPSGVGNDKAKLESNYIFISVEQCEDALRCKWRCVYSTAAFTHSASVLGAGDKAWKNRVAILTEQGGSYSRLQSWEDPFKSIDVSLPTNSTDSYPYLLKTLRDRACTTTPLAILFLGNM